MMEKDVKIDQDVTGQGVAQVASEDSVAPESKPLADGTTQDEHMIPKSRFDEVNQKAKDEEAARVLAEQKLAQAVQLQQQVISPTKPQPSSTYELAMQQLNLTADDLYGENIVRVQSLKAELDTSLQQQQALFSTNQQFISSHSDFTTVVGSVNPTTGQIMAWSLEALSLQQKKPYLATAFQSAQGAYESVMAERRLAELEKAGASTKEHQDRVDAATQPMGGSAAGGGGAGDPAGRGLMSRAEVREIQAKLDAGETVG